MRAVRQFIIVLHDLKAANSTSATCLPCKHVTKFASCNTAEVYFHLRVDVVKRGMEYVDELLTYLEDDYETETSEMWLRDLLALASVTRLTRKKFDEGLLANSQ
jgi:hypothetical protein